MEEIDTPTATAVTSRLSDKTVTANVVDKIMKDIYSSIGESVPDFNGMLTQGHIKALQDGFVKDLRYEWKKVHLEEKIRDAEARIEDSPEIHKVMREVLTQLKANMAGARDDRPRSESVYYMILHDVIADIKAGTTDKPEGE